jgi:hypothetical protein
MTGMVSSLQTFGEYASWHPHWHTIVLEGGFDRWDRFVYVPIGASEELAELWRVKVVELFRKRGLINADFAKKLLGWKHSGFSIESNTKIHTDSARQSLCQYIVRAPVSLEKLYWESDAGEELTVTAKACRKAWARLLAKVYEIDVLKCPKCGGRMSVVAVIRDPDEIRKIIMCLETKGRGPP